MFYKVFASYLTLVINFLEDRDSEEQILPAVTYQLKKAIAPYFDSLAIAIKPSICINCDT